MAKIQLDQEVLDVEILIDARSHDEAFRQLILLRDRFGRRPEFRYLKALFDVTFGARSDKDLLMEVRALVAEQPDFLEAVSLLAFLLDRTGDHDRATVFAREAIHSANERARERAARVLGDSPENPTADEEPFARRSSASFAAVHEVEPASPATLPKPVVVPTPGRGSDPKTRETREMFTPRAPDMPPPPPPLDVDPLRLPSKPPPLQDERLDSGDTLDGLPRAPSVPPITSDHHIPSTMPPPPEPIEGPTLRKPSTIPPMAMPSEPPGVMRGNGLLEREPFRRVDSDRAPGVIHPRGVDPRGEEPPSSQPPTKDARQLMAETIPFSPADMAMPPPPTIPPDAFDPASDPPGFVNHPLTPRLASAPPTPPEGRRKLNPWPRDPSTPQPARRDMPIKSERTTDRPAAARRAPTPLPPQYAIEHTGIDRTRTPTHPPAHFGRSAVAIPEPSKQVRAWFEYARENQLQVPPDGGFSTARTLLDLAERVVEGATPLSSEPIPLDRRGLILVEQRLEPMRGRTGTQPAAERGAVTAAAAFLLGLLLKECDGRASDTSAEDGACKVVVPSGATVRPLLVAAAFARSRGPSLLETFDRAATSHMRRGPMRRTGPGITTDPGIKRPERTVRGAEFDLTVLRRDLDASTLGATDPDAPPAPAPALDMRQLAVDFWASDLGREIIGSSRRVGSFTIADVDAIERYASKTFSAVGFAPPGTPWPWSPAEDLEELVLSWGAILGEVLVALYSGRWEADPGNPDDRHLFRVVLSGGVVSWPVAKTYMRLARGIAHDISVYVDAVGRVVGRQALERR